MSKISHLRETIDDLKLWLDSNCNPLICENQVSDPIELRQLALKYKNFLLQLKEHHVTINTVKSSLKSQQITDAHQMTIDEFKMLQNDIETVEKRWSSICTRAKKEYSKLSIALKNSKIRDVSPFSFSSSDSESNSRHASPEKVFKNSSSKETTTGDSYSLGAETVSLDLLLESLRIEAERQFESLNTELDALTEVHKPQPLPKPSVLGNNHRSPTTKNSQTLPVLFTRDKTNATNRHSSSTVNGNAYTITPTYPPPVPKRKKLPLRENYSCPAMSSESLSIRRAHSVVQIKSLTDMDLNSCRIAQKIDNVMDFLKRVDSILIPPCPCELQSGSIEGRISDVKGVLALLDVKVDDLRIIIQESQTYATHSNLGLSMTYTHLEYDCCADVLPQVYSSALNAQTMANEEICHLELVRDLIVQFEQTAVVSRDSLCQYEMVVTELRNGMLEGKMSNQPWTSAYQSLDAGQICEEKQADLSKLSNQLLSLEPQFNGQSIKEQMKSLEDSFLALQVDANVVIQSAISHRLKFAKEACKIFDDWLQKVDTQICAIQHGVLSGLAPEVKQNLCQQSTENLQTLVLTTEQLQCILNLASDARAGISNQQQVLNVQNKLAERKVRLETANIHVKGLKTSENFQATVKNNTSTSVDNMSKAINSNLTNSPTKKGLLYTEIEAKEANPSTLVPTLTPPMLRKPLKAPPPVYTEVIIPPKKMMDYTDGVQRLEIDSSSKESTPIPRSLSPSVSPTRTILHSSSPERNRSSPMESPSPPPCPHTLIIQENQSTKASPKHAQQHCHIDSEYSIGTNVYDIPRSHSIPTTLMLFIKEEYTAVTDATNVNDDGGFTTPNLKETLNFLSDSQGRKECQEFFDKLNKLKELLLSVKHDLAHIEVPCDTSKPLMEEEMQKCNILKEMLVSANALLSQYNYNSSAIHTILSKYPVSPTTIDSTTLNSLILQFELELFDLGCLYHDCQSQLRDKFQMLTDAESAFTSLHNDLEMLTNTLEEAKSLLGYKDSIVDVNKYLNECKEMHIKLTHHSNRRKNVASKIRELILNTTQRKDSHPVDLPNMQPSPHTFKLLEQLKNIETQWVNASHSLMNMPQLEPILLKNMMTNIAKEVKTLEHVYPAVEYDGLNLDEITDKFTLCETKLSTIKQMQSSLHSAKPRIEQLQDYQLKSVDQPRQGASKLDYDINESTRQDNLIKSGSLDRSITESTKLISSDDGNTLLPLKRRSIGVLQCETTFDYILLTKSVLTLSGLLERAVNELDSKYMALYQRKLILEKFWNESKNLGIWIRDIIHLLQENKEIATEPQMLLEQTLAKKDQLSELQDVAKQILGMHSSQTERKTIKNMIEKVTRGWQGMYKLLPLNVQVTVQPSEDTLTHLKPPDVFEDITQMIEWLILMESKLQPHPLDVGNTTQIKRALDDIEAMQKELNLKTPECQKFIKQNIHQTLDHNDSDSSTSSNSTASSSSKCVKFIDENTLERVFRKKQIKQDVILDTILSEDELDSEDSSDSDTPNNHSNTQIHVLPASLITQTTSITSPLTSPTSNEEATQQLSTLWSGVLSLLSQRKQILESILDIWNGFESKKSTLELFISQCTEQREELLKQIESPKSIADIGKELSKLKASCEEMALHQQKLGTLNDLTSDLIQRHKRIDNVNELQESMSQLNKRWRKVNENFLKTKPSIDAALSAWNTFYEVYEPFQNLIEETTKKVTKINQNVTELQLLENELDETKELHVLLITKSGNIGMIKQLNKKLQQTTILKKTDLSVVDNKLVELENNLEALLSNINEKKTFLEQAIAERKDILSVFYRCDTWCRHAKEHIAGQKPLTADVSILNAKMDVNKEFQREIHDKLTQLSLCFARAKHISADFTLPNSLKVHSPTGEDAKTAFLRVQSKLQEFDAEANEWRKSMESTLLIMSEFQQLSNKFQKMLKEISVSLPGAFESQITLPGLKQQLEKWQSIQSSNGILTKGLEAMVSSQKKLMEMGVQASPDAVQLVKKYHKQWNILKRSIDSNIDSIKNSIWKLDPSNLEMTLPRGWTKALTAQGTPYYIDTLSGNRTQWQHPELSELYKTFVTRSNYVYFPSPAYPISLHLRNIQKCIHIEHIPTHMAMDTFDMYKLNTSNKTTSNEMTEIVLSIYQRVLSQTMDESMDIILGVQDLNINRAVELTVSWIQDVFDITHSGSISVLAFEVALISLSTAKMEDKHKALFQVATNGNTTMDMESMRKYLEILLQIPQSVSDHQYCSLDFLDKSVNECFRKFATGDLLHSVGYLAWAQDEPLPISWLPILHRMTAAETMIHNVKCSVCKDTTITGFRYKCLQCQNFNMCQDCYWSGKTAKEHDRTKHFMEEYCISSDEKGMFFRTLGNRGKKKSLSKTPPRDSPGPQSPNHLSSQYEKDRIQQLKQQLSNPNHKKSTPEYYTLSLRRDTGGLASSLAHASSKSDVPIKRNSNSFSNLTDEYLYSLSQNTTNYPISPKPTHNGHLRLPHSKSVDADLALGIKVGRSPPPVPNKPMNLKSRTQLTGNDREVTKPRGVSGHYDNLA